MLILWLSGTFYYAVFTSLCLDSGVYDETGDCKHHHSTTDCRAAGDQCQVFA